MFITKQTVILNRRILLKLSGLTAIGGAVAYLVGCAKADANQYSQTNLVASNIAYQAQFTEPSFINAWGIAIRPKGAGGHFWVGAGNTSYQYLGDVKGASNTNLQSLSQDALKVVTVNEEAITGVVYNGADLNSSNFRVNAQTAAEVAFDGSARFVFVTDSGKVSGWTDRSNTGAIARVDGAAQQMYDGSADGSAFFGVAIKTDSWDTMWLADFGENPSIVTLSKDWIKVPTVGFANPFGSGAGGAVIPGDPVPFNIQVLAGRAFVTYAISQDAGGRFDAGEEEAMDAAEEAASGNKPNKGKLVEFTQSGELVRIFDDAMRLNAPWGLAIAPSNFGELSGALLVGNFGGAGRISAFDLSDGSYINDMLDGSGKPVAIAGLWGLQFGNGESLGDSNALYFAAGPEDEAEGLFGSLRSAS
jgi:uncharacterized protein (TIGR03118 family)